MSIRSCWLCGKEEGVTHGDQSFETELCDDCYAWSKTEEGEAWLEMQRKKGLQVDRAGTAGSGSVLGETGGSDVDLPLRAVP